MPDISKDYWDKYWSVDNRSLITKLAHYFRKIYFAGVFADFIFKKTKARGKTVLEIGCGSALILYHLEKLGVKNTVGIDSSGLAVRIARKNSPKSKIILGDAFKIPLPDKSADTVFNVGLLEHFRRAEQKILLSEMRRVARDYVVNIMPANTLAMRIIQLIGRFAKRKGTFSDEQIFNHQVFKDLGLKGKSFVMRDALAITIGHVEKV